MAGRVKADCGANLIEHSSALYGARLALVARGTAGTTSRRSCLSSKLDSPIRKLSSPTHQAPRPVRPWRRHDMACSISERHGGPHRGASKPRGASKQPTVLSMTAAMFTALAQGRSPNLIARDQIARINDFWARAKHPSGRIPDRGISPASVRWPLRSHRLTHPSCVGQAALKPRQPHSPANAAKATFHSIAQ